MSKKKVSFGLLCFALFASLAWSQSSPPISTLELTLPLNSTDTPASQANLVLIGNPGPSAACYWLVSHFLLGEGSPVSIGCINTLPNALSGSNYVQVTPFYPAGVLTVDLLKTATTTPPSGACNCAVATAVAAGAINDQSNSTNSYTLNAYNPSNFSLTLDNEVQGAGSTHLILRQNGIFVSDLSISGGFTVGGDLFSNSSSSQEVVGLKNNPLPALSVGFLNWTGTTWALSAGNMTWPATPGITVCTGTPCTAWGTSLTAPAGAIVGTTDVQALTNKTVDGVSPATMAFLDATSSIQTQLNGKAALAGATFTGEVVTKASATGGAGFNLPPGVAPTSPVNGDCWTTSAGLFCQINAATVGPFGTGSSAVSSVSNSDGTLTISPTAGAVVASLALGHANTWTAVQTLPSPILTGTPDASGAAQFKLPVAASFASLANGECGYDSTNSNWHCWNGADSIMVPLAVGFTSGDCGQPTQAGGKWTYVDAGSPCGTSTGANPALSNLASVSINTSLLAQTGVDLGSTAKPLRNLYLYGTGTYGTNYFELTGAPSSTRVLTLPDAAGTFAVSANSPITLSAAGAIGCATCGVTGSPLSQFASTTSAQLAGVLSDKIGSGKAVFATALQGTDVNLMTAGTVSGTSVLLCTDSNAGATTVGCPTASFSGLNTNGVLYASSPTAATTFSPPTANGIYSVIYNVTAGASVAPSASLPGVPPNPQTGTTYTIGAANTWSDRATYISFNNAASIAVTLPQANSTGFTQNWAAKLCDIGAGTATITPTTSTISYTDGVSYTSGASSMPLATGQCAALYSDNANYFATLQSGNGSSINGGTIPASAVLVGTNSSKQLFAAGLASAHLYVGNSSNLPVDIALTGDASLTNAGLLTVTQIEGAAIPTSAPVVATNSGKQLIAATTTGSGSTIALATSPSLVTPSLGVATATSINKVSITAPATGSTLTIADGKTLTVSNTMTLAGTDSSTYTFPSASATMTQTIASGTAAMNTSAVASGACATVVTVSATGVATTDAIKAGFNTDPTAITGYGASATGAVLTIYAYPTANNVNFKVCNSSSGSITPSALTLNWRVER